MKHLLHWGACVICAIVSAVVFSAYGWAAWVLTLLALICALLMAWYEGLME